VKTHHDAYLRLAFSSALLALPAVGCDQPTPRCTVAAGDFAVKYTLKTQVQGDCAALPGEVLSLQVYYPPQSSDDYSPNFDKATIGLQPSSITGLIGEAAGGGVVPDTNDKPYGLGAFTASRPGDDDHCAVPELTEARVRLPAWGQYTSTDDEGNEFCHPASGPIDVSYKFTQMRVYNTPGAYGTQLTGVLTYTTPTCTAVYDIAGVYPAVPCNVDATPPTDMTPTDGADLPTEGGDVTPGGSCPETSATPQAPDDSACGEGSGISPEFAVSCDPTLLMCVLAKTPPSLR
jgi:hypothetical protein